LASHLDPALQRKSSSSGHFPPHLQTLPRLLITSTHFNTQLPGSMHTNSDPHSGELGISMEAEPVSEKAELPKESGDVKPTGLESSWVELTEDGKVAVPSKEEQTELYHSARDHDKELIFEPFSGLASLSILHYRHALREMESKVVKNEGVMDDEQLRLLRDTLREYCRSSLLFFHLRLTDIVRKMRQ